MKAFDYDPKFTKSELSNGVRVITEHHPYTRATCVGFYVDLGTRDEPENIVGAAHFLEHFLFKGTKKRNAYQIVAELEAVGGDINAYTSKEYTCFHAGTLREHAEISMDVLADLVISPTMDEEELLKEREVVLQEIEMSKDQLEEYIFDLYFEEAYKGHPLGRSILGDEASLERMNRQNLMEFFNERYHGHNLIVAVAGDVTHERALEILKPLEDIKRPVAKVEKRKPPKINTFRRYIERPAEQIHFIAGMPSVKFHAERRFDAYIINAVLGGGMTSRLYQKVREEQALAYNVYSYLHSYTDTGLLMTYAATTAEKLPQVTEAIHKEIRDIKKNCIAAKELDFFKRQVMGQILLGADDIENRMNSIAVNEMVFGRYRPVDEVVKEIDGISLDSVREYLDEYFDEEAIGVILLGDVEDSHPGVIENEFGN